MAEIDKDVRAAMLVPDSTKTNYAEDIRRAAAVRDISVDEAKSLRVKEWRAQHEVDPVAGWNVLADWLESDSTDLKGYLGDLTDPYEALKVRALESAKRDPGNPLAAAIDKSDPEVRAEIEASQTALAEQSNPAPVETPVDEKPAKPAAKTPAK
jgi:hypothetical protein